MSPSDGLSSIGRYEIVGHLAKGGMAEILLARLKGPSGFERPVAIKRILPHLAEQQRFVDMFLDEARIAAAIRHKNVVQVTDLGHTGAHLYLVMEYLEGENIASLIKRSLVEKHPLPYGITAHVIAEACAGLHAAHELCGEDGHPLGVVHRDISPQNVLVTYSGEVKVLDFGIAKALVRVAAETDTGELKGKVEYMSPEQARGQPLDKRSDLFALGIVLHEMLARRRLFKRDSVLGTFEAITKEPLVLPSQVARDCPPSLDRVVARALARDPADRYASAADMRRDLLAVVHETLGGADVERGLSKLMGDLFRERIEEKREMLRRLRAGDAPPAMPAAETDESLDIPDLVLPLAPSSRRDPIREVSASAATIELMDGFEPGGRVSAPAPLPPAAQNPFAQADLEALVTDAVARFGMAGTALIEAGRVRLVGAGPEVSCDLAGAADGLASLAPELKQRRAQDLARRLVQARRDAVDIGSGRRRGLPGFVAPLVGLVVVGAGVVLAFKFLTPGSKWSWGTPSATATAVSADEYERQRAERAQRVCEATRSRIMRGASIGPTDVEGWVVELSLARAAPGPATDPALGEFVSGSRFTWKDAAEISKHEGIDTAVSVAPEPVPLDSSPHGVRVTFSGKYVTPYFYSGERRAFLKIAGAMADKLGASHGALYARCALGSPHHLGAWFLGPSPGGAAASLIYWIGAFGDPAQVRQSILFPDGGSDLRSSGVLGRIADKTQALDRNKVRSLIGQHDGMITGKPDGPSTLTFSFADANRAARASMELSRVSEVGVDR
ncbi:MAG: serine/threonine protein kinase [Polyangiaceae bacterium]|nr:serine/threonine protein kinase [Polyangiaceae bacterium]